MMLLCLNLKGAYLIDADNAAPHVFQSLERFPVGKTKIVILPTGNDANLRLNHA